MFLVFPRCHMMLPTVVHHPSTPSHAHFAPVFIDAWLCRKPVFGACDLEPSLSHPCSSSALPTSFLTFTCKHSSEPTNQTLSHQIRPRSRRPSPPHQRTKDQGTRTLRCGAAPEATWNKQAPEPSSDLPGTRPHGLLIMDAPQENKSHDPLALPAPEVLAEIARKQDARAAEIRATRAARRHSKDGGSVSEEQTRNNAALLIQKNYRGYKTRRAMQGRGLDPSVRWIEALKEGALYGQGIV
jgi:hypothetical protein